MSPSVRVAICGYLEGQAMLQQVGNVALSSILHLDTRAIPEESHNLTEKYNEMPTEDPFCCFNLNPSQSLNLNPSQSFNLNPLQCFNSNNFNTSFLHEIKILILKNSISELLYMR